MNYGTDLMNKSTVMFKMLYVAALSLFAVLPAPVVVAAGILSDDAVVDAAAADLKAETALLRTIQEGITLSIATCKIGDSCKPAVNRDELERIIASLNLRIGNLSQRFQDTGEEELADILVSYTDILDAYNGCMEQLVEYTGAAEGVKEDDLGEDEFDVFQDADDDL